MNIFYLRKDWDHPHHQPYLRQYLQGSDSQTYCKSGGEQNNRQQIPPLHSLGLDKLLIKLSDLRFRPQVYCVLCQKQKNVKNPSVSASSLFNKYRQLHCLQNDNLSFFGTSPYFRIQNFFGSKQSTDRQVLAIFSHFKIYNLIE